jgi:cold shock CspA family protein
MTGTVKRIAIDNLTGERRGFGFIEGDDGMDYFFHASQCTEPFADIDVEERVRFDTVDSDRGPRAVAVTCGC